jgi:hypothetical protein
LRILLRDEPGNDQRMPADLFRFINEPVARLAGGKAMSEKPTDIVDQLRVLAADVPITLALDAAVEIERLRTALQKIAHPEWGEYPPTT